MTALWSNHADKLSAAIYESPRFITPRYPVVSLSRWPDVRDCIRALANEAAFLREAVEERAAEDVHFVPSLAHPADCGVDVSSARVTNRFGLVTCVECRRVATARARAREPEPMTLEQYFNHYGCE